MCRNNRYSGSSVSFAFFLQGRVGERARAFSESHLLVSGRVVSIRAAIRIVFIHFAVRLRRTFQFWLVLFKETRLGYRSLLLLQLVLFFGFNPVQ